MTDHHAHNKSTDTETETAAPPSSSLVRSTVRLNGVKRDSDGSSSLLVDSATPKARGTDAEANKAAVDSHDDKEAVHSVPTDETVSDGVTGQADTSDKDGHDNVVVAATQSNDAGIAEQARAGTSVDKKPPLLPNNCHHGCAPSYTSMPVDNGKPSIIENGKFVNHVHCADMPLYHYNDVPSWQQNNPYILRGYRAFYSTKMAIKSVMRWHNETVNIWSHVIGFAAFLLLTIALFATVMHTSSKTPALYFSHLVYAVFSLGSMMCMLNSSIYHLFNCHCSERVTIILSRIDFLGITVLIVTSFLPPLYVGFHCYPVARTVYIASILTLGTAALACPCTDFFYKHECLRTAVFVAMAFSGLVPLVHASIILPHTRQCIEAFCGVLLMMVLYLIGLLFYVTKFPESYFPGRFDCFLSSHQLWHFFVCMAALVHFCNSVGLYETWSVSDGVIRLIVVVVIAICICGIKMSVGTRGTSQTRSRVRAASSRRPGAGRSRTPQRSRKSGQSSVMGGSVGASSRTSSDMVTTARTAVSSAGQRPEQTMSDCKQQSMAPYNHDSEMPLYTIDQVPEYMRSNPFILRGYRAYYSTYQCIASLLRLHNETFNVWTHLLGGVVFVVLIYSLFVRTLIPEYIQGSTRTSHTLGTQVSGMQHSSGEGASDTTKAWMYPATQGHTPWSLFLFGCFSFACLACMLCSASYHLFTAHLSEPLYNWAHALDYFGITFLIVGSFLPFCYCLFLCVPIWRNTYLTMIMSFGIIGLLGPFFRHWTTDSFAVKKVIFYVCMVGSGIFPILHIRFLPFNVGKPYFARLLTMMVLYGTGVFFYAFKIPERWYPGLFDTYGSSHQIFHVFVLGAAITHFLNCVDMYKNHDKMICPV